MCWSTPETPTPSPSVATLAKGADLLIHECSFPEPFDVTNPTTPRKLGSKIQELGIKRVVSRTSIRRLQDARKR